MDSGCVLGNTRHPGSGGHLWANSHTSHYEEAAKSGMAIIGSSRTFIGK